MDTQAKLTFLRGTKSSASDLAILDESTDVVREIVGHVDLWESHRKSVIKTDEAYMIVRSNRTEELLKNKPFPEPTGININMMPITLFPKDIPEEYHKYIPLIHACPLLPWDKDHKRRVYYLTIHEESVPVGQAHRRPGLHIERPNALRDNPRILKPPAEFAYDEYYCLTWGLGRVDGGMPVDGIYMISNVDASCAVWPILIDHPEQTADRHGGIEHMREHLGEGHRLKANELCWITDRTPHESLPIQAVASDPGAQAVYRQFFRLVAGPIAVWYAKHSTLNPLGVQPDAPISQEDKFARR